MPDIARELSLALKTSSAFLFGPRMCGKTTLLKKLSYHTYFDLLDPAQELKYKTEPKLFWEELRNVPKSALVIIDEVQRVPALLDYVQMAIDQKKMRFILSGSSARKLRRHSVNLLGGRAVEKRLYPLSYRELGDSMEIDAVLASGSLPRIAVLAAHKQTTEVRAILQTYYQIYLKEEIQAEALTRNVPAFARFLKVAAQSHGQTIEFANIGRDSQVADSTVKEYFSILEDTLIGSFLPQWDASERKKSRSKFYFFDSGVVRAIQNRLYDPPTGQEMGWLFEGWFVNEVIKIRDYLSPYLGLSFWQQGDHEIDLLIGRSERYPLAIEIKSGSQDEPSAPTVAAFAKKFPKTKLIVASKQAKRARTLDSGIEILPWREALAKVEQA